MAACLMACITHAEINLNNNLLCLSLVSFSSPPPPTHPLPLHYTTCSCGQPHPPRHPVWTRAALHSPGPHTYSTRDPAAVSDLSVSSLFSFLLLLLLLFTWLERYTHSSDPFTLISFSYIASVYSKSYTEPQSVCICGCVRACASMHARACLTELAREGAAGDRTQTILRLWFFMISPLIPENLPSLFLSSVSLLHLKALGTNSTSGSIEPYLSGIKTGGIFSGRVPSPAAAFAPGLRKYPQEGAVPSLTASSSQAKALLASLSASGLNAEALLLSSTLRHHRLLREQRASSLPLPSSQSSSPPPPTTSSSSTSSPTTPTLSLSPSSPTSLTSLTLSSMGLKRSTCSLDSSTLNSCKEGGSISVNKDLTPGNPRWWRGGGWGRHIASWTVKRKQLHSSAFF